MKVAVVTGSSYGLGKSISLMLLKNEFKVYGMSRTNPNIENKNFVWLKADLLDEKCFEFINSSIFESKIDLLVNNAGVVMAEKALDFSVTTFNKVFGLNLVAPIKITALLKNKINGGTVVNISSTSDRFAEDSLGMYCSSKAALDIYFDSVAIENPQIKIVNILPVYMDTPMLDSILKELEFTTDDAINTEVFAEAVKKIIFNQDSIESGARVIVLSNKSLSEVKSSEKLYYFNVDTEDFKKIK